MPLLGKQVKQADRQTDRITIDKKTKRRIFLNIYFQEEAFHRGAQILRKEEFHSVDMFPNFLRVFWRPGAYVDDIYFEEISFNRTFYIQIVFDNIVSKMFSL